MRTRAERRAHVQRIRDWARKVAAFSDYGSLWPIKRAENPQCSCHRCRAYKRLDKSKPKIAEQRWLQKKTPEA